MKLGIIGTGMIVRDFLPEFMKMDGLSVCSVMGSPGGFEKAEALSGEFGIPKAVRSLQELCETGIDTVYVAVPNSFHYEYCKEAMLRGMHVIVEKPMTDDPAKARELEALAREQKVMLFEAITTIYMDGYRKILEWLPRIGELKHIESRFCQYSSRYDRFKRGEHVPVFDPGQSGGALMDLNVYNLFFVMGIAGKPEEVTYYPNLERGVDTNGVVVMQYPGFTAVCTAAKGCNGRNGGTILGTDGMIESVLTPNIVGDVYLTLRDGTREVFEEKYAAKRMIPEFEQFIRAVNEKDHDFCHAQLAKSIDVCDVLCRARGE